MKYLTICCLVITSTISWGQSTTSKNSAIDLKGNGNIIRVIQTDQIVEYNLSIKTQSDRFIRYLNSFPNLNFNIKRLLTKTDKVLEILSHPNKTDSFTSKDLLDRFEKYIRENENLRLENEKLRQQSNDNDYSALLEEANKRLEQFDDEGYQKILQKGLERFNKTRMQIARIYYLQARNNYTNYHYKLALQQVNEAVIFIPNDPALIILRSEILTYLNRAEEALNYLKDSFKNITQDSIISEANLRLGFIYLSLDNFDSALSYSQKAIKLENKYYDKDDYFSPLCVIGLIYLYQADYNKALDFFKNALEVERRSSGKAGYQNPILFSNIGTAYYFLHKYDSALYYSLSAVTFLQEVSLDETPLLRPSYETLFSIYVDQKNLTKAEEYKNKIETIIDKYYGKYSIEKAITYNNIAFYFEHTSIKDSSIFYYNKSLNILRTINPNHNAKTGLVASNIGYYYNSKNQYDSAIIYFENALSNYQEIYDKVAVQLYDCYQPLGLAYYHSFNYSMAFHIDSLALVTSKKKYGTVSSNSQEMYFKLGILDLIEEKQVEAIEYLNKTTWTFPTILQRIKSEAQQLSTWDRHNAIKLMLAQMDLLKQKPDLNQFALLAMNTSLGIAQYYNTIKDFKHVIEYYENALGFAKQTQNPILDQVNICVNIAQYYASIDNSKRTIQFYLKALNLSKQGENLESNQLNICMNIAQYYNTINDTKHAIQFYFKALKYANQCQNPIMNRLNVCLSIAHYYCNLGDKIQASDFFEKAIKLSSEIKTPIPPIIINTTNIMKQYNDCKSK